MNDKIKIIKNLDAASYKKKYGKFSYKLLSFSKKEVEAFDKKNKALNGNSLLKGKNWALIGDTYYQIPKAGLGWFRNMSAAGKTAVSLVACGVVGAAVATPLIINANNHGAPEVEVEKGEGIKNVTETVDTEGNTTVTAEPEKETEGVNKDSVEVYLGLYKLEEDEFEIIDDTKIIIKKEVTAAHPGKMRVVIKATTVSTPEKFDMTDDGEISVKDDAEGKLCIPANVKGKPVTTLKKSEKPNTKVNEVVVSNNVREMADGMFEGYSSLRSARVSDNMENMPKNSFRGCNQFEELRGGSHTRKIGERAFEDCNLKKLALKEAKEIEKRALANNRELLTLTLSNEVRNLPPEMCQNDRALTTLTGCANTTVVEEKCFDGCNSLRKPEFFDRMQKTGDYAFRNNFMLGNFTVPETLKEFGFGCFENCVSSREVRVDSKELALAGKEKDYHGAFHNADRLYIKKSVLGEQQPGEGVLQTFTLNKEESQKDPEYDVFDLDTTYTYGYASYTSYDDKQEPINNFCSIRYNGKELADLVIPGEVRKSEEREARKVNSINSFGFSGNTQTKTVAFKSLGKTGGFSIGTDFENGYSFYGCSGIEEFKDIQFINQICGHSFEGCSGLKEFHMPIDLWNDDKQRFMLGPDSFKGCDKMMKLYFSAEKPESGNYLYNIQNNDSKMFKNNQEVYISKSAPKPESNSFIENNKVGDPREETLESGDKCLVYTLSFRDED